jgi:hypothetical protein
VRSSVSNIATETVKVVFSLPPDLLFPERIVVAGCIHDHDVIGAGILEDRLIRE